ncbi:DNA repair protein RecO [Marinomonas epiphytica]
MRDIAYVIHTRPFQDGKILLDLLTQEHGLIRGVWRLPKKEARVIPGPFLPFHVEFSGRTELKSLRSLESVDAPKRLEGLTLYAGLYIHELISKLVPLNLPLQAVFELYEWLINGLANNLPVAPILRRFEVGMFAELGVQIDLSATARGQTIDVSQLYQFHLKFGLQPYYGERPKVLPALYLDGATAQGYQQGQWTNKSVLALAKELHRYWLDSLLNGRDIMTRQLLSKQEYQGERLYGVPVFRYQA